MGDWGEIKTDWKEAFTARSDKRADKSGYEEMKIKKKQDYFNQTFKIIKEIDFTIPKQNEALTLITTKSFSAFGLVEYILQNSIEKLIEMTCFIYSLNSKVAEKINEIAEQTEKTNIVISDLQNTAYRTKEKAVLECLTSKKIEAIFVHSHAKIISLKFETKSFTILGSGNLAENARVEQYQIINSIEMYQFIYDTFDEMRKFQIEKRNKDLWHTIK